MRLCGKLLRILIPQRPRRLRFIKCPEGRQLIARGKAPGKLNFKPKVPVKLEDFANKKKRDVWIKEKAGRPQDIADVFYLKKIEKKWKDE